MSAFVVEKSHINAMLHSAFQAGLKYRGNFSWYFEKEHKELTTDNADEIGQMLLDENIKSVGHRYEDSEITDLPGRADADYILPFVYKPFTRSPKPVEALKITGCYEYQSCEHPEWEASEAKAFCDALQHRLIDMLPGYEEAPWDWTDPLYDEAQPQRIA